MVDAGQLDDLLNRTPNDSTMSAHSGLKNPALHCPLGDTLLAICPCFICHLILLIFFSKHSNVSRISSLNNFSRWGDQSIVLVLRGISGL